MKGNGTMKTNRIIFKAWMLGLILLLTTGCNNSFVHKYEDLSSNSNGDLGTLLPPGPSGGNGDLVIIDGARTASVVHSGQVLKNMVAVSGIEEPSASTKALYEQKKGSFSENGKANTVNAPMVMAAASLGGEVCNDLVNKERGLPQGERRIFPQVDFGSGPNNVSNTARMDIVRRMARSFWGRNETDTGNLALYTCTIMLASLDSMEL